MGKGLCRIGDMSAGDCGNPPTAAVQGSSNVLANGLGAVRDGDEIEAHGHPRTAVGGSSTVFINSKAAVRIDDSITCGDKMAEGSSTVIVG